MLGSKKCLKPGFKLVKYLFNLIISAIYVISVNNKRNFFLPYASSNLLCGKLVCAWPHKALVSRANLSVIYTHIREDICVSTFLHSGKLKFTKAEDRDETFVQDGSACGPEMVTRTTEFQVFKKFFYGYTHFDNIRTNVFLNNLTEVSFTIKFTYGKGMFHCY